MANSTPSRITQLFKSDSSLKSNLSLKKIIAAGVDTKIQYNKSLFINSELLLRPKNPHNEIFFSEVMNQLAFEAGWRKANGQGNGVGFFADWWASAEFSNKPYSEDNIYGCNYSADNKYSEVHPGYSTPNIASLINEQPYVCPRREGTLSRLTSLKNKDSDEELFKIIGIVNRGDLSGDSINPKSCGEYRLIARGQKDKLDQWNKDHIGVGVDNSDNYFISLEFALRNEDPSGGTKFCSAVQRFWAGLSKLDMNDLNQANKLAEQIKKFFFQKNKIDNHGNIEAGSGELYEFGPIISIYNLGLPKSMLEDVNVPKGQIRTNTQPNRGNFSTIPLPEAEQWLMREYRVLNTGHEKKLRIVPAALPGVLSPSSLYDNNVNLSSEIASNSVGLTTKYFEDAGFKASNCTQASELLYGANSHPERVYPETLNASELCRGSSCMSTETVGSLDDLTNPRSVKIEKIFNNMEFGACSGCHGAVEKGDIKLASKKGWPFNIIDNTLTDFSHTEKVNYSNVASGFVTKTLLPWRCYVMRAQVNSSRIPSMAEYGALVEFNNKVSTWNAFLRSNPSVRKEIPMIALEHLENLEDSLGC